MTETPQAENTPPVEIWDNSQRAKQVLIVFGILIGLAVIGLISSYFELRLLQSALDGTYIDDQKAEANDLRQMLIGFLQIGIFIASMVVFLNWFRRAYGNLHRITTSFLVHKEKMAVWAWFIPIIHLFRPVQIMNEIWDETQAEISKLDSSYIPQNGRMLVGIWWTLHIITMIFERATWRTALKDETLEQLIEGTLITMVSDLMVIPEAALVMFIVYRFSKIETTLAYTVRIYGGEIIKH